jgi:threonine aldolase
MFDLRSDTVTKPTKEIIKSAIDAELGDDEYGEDPTVNKLEDQCAQIFGFEKGLFVTSGLMGNQISLLVHNDPGTEVITPFDSHIKNYEHGAAAFLSRVQFRDINNNDGVLDIDELTSLISKSKVHKPKISTISIENTHLASGGSIVPYDHIKLISKVAKENDLKLHMDGARIWHAILQEKSTTDYGCVVDSLTFCFSKALGAPIGSMLLGSADFIAEAREYRKKLGGGMRQVGVIASMARASLESRDNLLQDHEKAKSVYENISKKINNEKITSIDYKNTNMILLKIAKDEEPNKFLEILNTNDIKSGLLNKDTIRFVFHKDIPIEDVDKISDKIIHSSSEF